MDELGIRLRHYSLLASSGAWRKGGTSLDMDMSQGLTTPVSGQINVDRFCDVSESAGKLLISFADPGDAAKVQSVSPDGQKLLGDTLERLAKNLNKKKKTADAEWHVELQDAGGIIKSDMTCIDAWLEGQLLVCRRGSAGAPFSYVVRRNRPRLLAPPLVTMLPLVGFPLLAHAQAEHYDRLEWQWLRGEVCVGTEQEYRPEAEDLGWRLRVRCIPWQQQVQGGLQESACNYPVHMIAPEALEPLHSRIALAGEHRVHASLRVISYNIQWAKGAAALAKENSKKGHTTGPAEISRRSPHDGIGEVQDLPVPSSRGELAREYREHVLLREILGYNADIICLQEVSSPNSSHLFPFLEQSGLTHWQSRDFKPDGSATDAAGELAIFWRNTSFVEERSESWHIGSLLQNEWNEDLCTALEEQQAPLLRDLIRNKVHTAQAVMLRSRSDNRRIVVVNTHLTVQYPEAHIRAIQACLVLRQVHHWVGLEALGQQHESPQTPTLILCGDFNCQGKDPEAESCLVLAMKGEVSRNHYNFVQGRNVARPAAPDGRTEAASAQTCSARSGALADPNVCRALPHAPSCFCWDHTCPWCGSEKESLHALCSACRARGVEAPAPTPSLGPIFSCTLSQPFGPLTSAYGELTGSPCLFCTEFHPASGRPYHGGYQHMKDHIFCGGALRPAWVLPAPPEQTFLRGMPNLNWGSDHPALLVDFTAA